MWWNELNKHEVVPIQNTDIGRTIPKEIAEAAYLEYCEQFGGSQSFERLHQRGGFGFSELSHLLYLRIKQLENNNG